MPTFDEITVFSLQQPTVVLHIDDKSLAFYASKKQIFLLAFLWAAPTG